MQTTTATENTPSFGRLRSLFWPIYSFELKKLLPMFAMFFLIAFVYNLLRSMKISLIITAPGSGAEVVPFLKIGAVLPAALLFTFIFTKLNNRFTREQVFYCMIFGFLSYFALFMTVLYPCKDYLQLNSFADFLQGTILSNDGFVGLVAIIRHWNLAVFYVVCEMWSSIVLSMLFWGFANEVTKVNEAKRFYAIFALGANISGIFVGLFTRLMNSVSIFNISFYEEQNQWIFYQLFFVLIIGFVIVGIFSWMNNTVFSESRDVQLKVKKKKKLSLGECFSYMRTSKYLLCIVTIVVAYNIVYNLADVMWTNKVKEVYTSSKDVNNYINLVGLLTGVAAAVSAFLISGNVVRYFGWTIAALVTPLVWALTSFGFFSGLLFERSILFDMFYNFIGNPANLVLLIGSIQICLGRGCKYTVFDETKEIAFIPLSQENKRKGKAVVDGIASRFGKSGGAFVYILLFMVFGDIAATVPYVSVIILLAILLWVFAVLNLGKMVKHSIDEEAVDKGLEFDESGEIIEKNSKDSSEIDTSLGVVTNVSSKTNPQPV